MKLQCLALSALLFATGCGHGATAYTPQLRARGELVLFYDDGFTMMAGNEEISSGSTWYGLPGYVECVPEAHDHARAAQTAGGAAVALTWIGPILSFGSLSSLGGLYFVDPPHGQPDIGLAAGILAGGVAVSLVGLLLAALGKHEKTVANGHALDAMNYYNDAVGSRGGTCDDPPADLPSVEAAPRKDAESGE